jgi:hypothetical protein
MVLEPEHIKTIEDFALVVRAAARGLWTGALDFLFFYQSMVSSLNRGYRMAWAEGMAECGLTLTDMTPSEQAALQQEIIRDTAFISGFGDYIMMGQRGTAKLSRTMTRAELWVNRYNAIRHLAQSMACADQKLKWVLGPTRDHCEDCSKYAGRVHRASIWAKYATLPQSRDLECKGFRCQCQLVPTTEPALPGRPPAPTGGGFF